MKILGIGAHPDDIEIFMFGLLLCYKSEGHEIFTAIATDGAAGDVLGYKNLVNVRKQETIDALSLLGKPHFFNFPDGDLASINNGKEKIKEYIFSIKPDLIITHAPEDYHSDHRALSAFIREVSNFICPILYTDTLLGVNFNPDYYVDITNHFPEKIKAILKHESQNPQTFLEATELLNRFRSAQCNSPKGHYAEAFRIDKSFPFSDIRDLLPPSPGINNFYQSLSRSMI